MNYQRYPHSSFPGPHQTTVSHVPPEEQATAWKRQRDESPSYDCSESPFQTSFKRRKIADDRSLNFPTPKRFPHSIEAQNAASPFDQRYRQYGNAMTHETSYKPQTPGQQSSSQTSVTSPEACSSNYSQMNSLLGNLHQLRRRQRSNHHENPQQPFVGEHHQQQQQTTNQHPVSHSSFPHGRRDERLHSDQHTQQSRKRVVQLRLSSNLY